MHVDRRSTRRYGHIETRFVGWGRLPFFAQKFGGFNIFIDRLKLGFRFLSFL